MPKLTIHVTRDASITYSAVVELSQEEIIQRCGKHGFDAEGLDIKWEETNKSTYDNVERYEIEDDSGAILWDRDMQ